MVKVQDAGGYTVSTSSAPVSLSITTPAGATLTCNANPINAVSGVATFAGCRINKTGTYTLTAASGGLTSSVTTSFTIATGPASTLVFFTNPSLSSTGGAQSVPVSPSAQDRPTPSPSRRAPQVLPVGSLSARSPW